MLLSTVLPFLASLRPTENAPRLQLPEEDMTTSELIAYRGYPAQEVQAVTKDGYILTMHRIPFGKNDTPSSGRPVVFLQHGLLASSADWVINDPDQSLGFLLADAGYDVFLGNVRGNVYSRGHTNASIDPHDYWQFSWDEIAAFDLEAMVDKALAVANQPWLYYVGYSQGTLMMFTKVSEEPQFARKIKKFFALAPVVTVGSAHGLLPLIGKKFLPEIELFIRVTGENEFLPSNTFTKILSKLVCGVFAFTNPLCENILFLMVGHDTKQLNATRLMVYLSHIPAGTSTQNIIHWAQMTLSGRTEKYDYGDEKSNQLHYGQATPPLYNLSRFNLPTYLYYSDEDSLADTEDVKILLSSIPRSSIMKEHKLTEFNHIDFVYGMRAAKEIYAEILTEIKDHETNVIRAPTRLDEKKKAWKSRADY